MKHIPLTQGQVAIVDDADFEWLNRWKWYARKRVRKRGNIFYAQRMDRNKKGRIIAMHCQLLPGCAQVDHINGEGLDNRRENIRPCTNIENQQNQRKRIGCTSRYKGVCWRKDLSKWQSNMQVAGRKIHLGYFLDEASAGHAYDAAAIIHFGEFALTNKAMHIS